MKKLFFLLNLLLFASAPSIYSETKVYFSPNGNIQKEIIQRIKNCTGTLDVMCFSISARPIAESILQARNRGVFVRIIFDRSETKNKGSLYKFLKNNGIDVKLSSGVGKKGIMHNKIAIFDGKTFVTGSYNWTNDAEWNNYENVLFCDDQECVEDYRKEFDKLWINAE